MANLPYTDEDLKKAAAAALDSGFDPYQLTCAMAHTPPWSLIEGDDDFCEAQSLIQELMDNTTTGSPR